MSATGSTPHPYRWTMLGGLWLAYFGFGLVTASIAPLVQPIARDLGLSYSAMGTVLGVWQLTYIASAAACSTILDRIGIRRGVALGGLVIAASALFRSQAVDYVTLLLAVAVFGLGGPLLSTGAPKLISQWFEGQERGTAVGIYITGAALGQISGLSLTNSMMMPLLGDDWRRVILTYAGFVLSTTLAWFLIASHPASREVERLASAEPRRRQREVFAGLLRLGVVRIVLAMGAGIFFFNHSLNNWLPEILRSGGMPAEAAGHWSAIPTAIGIFAALLVPRLATPPRRFRILAGLFVSAAVATVLIQTQSGPLLAAGLIFQGLARGAMTATTMLVLLEARGVDGRNTAAAGGLFFTAAEIGGVLGPMTLGAVHDITDGFSAGLGLLTGICAGLLLLVWALARHHRAAAG